MNWKRPAWYGIIVAALAYAFLLGRGPKELRPPLAIVGITGMSLVMLMMTVQGLGILLDREGRTERFRQSRIWGDRDFPPSTRTWRLMGALYVAVGIGWVGALLEVLHATRWLGSVIVYACLPSFVAIIVLLRLSDRRL